MLKPDRSSYSVTDLFEWYTVGKLVLTPKFQRRSVWNSKARSFLIDSILLEMPIPPIYIRLTQNEKRDAVVREVVDGQQRLAAVFEYMKGSFALSKTIEYDAGGKKFAKLSVDDQDRIKRYTFIAEIFQGISDAEVLKLFSRLNSYSVKLNEQELRHGEYFGAFKVTVYDLALQYLEFWRKSGLFSDQSVARMLEAEFASELLIFLIDGLQDKKKSIDTFYDKFDESFPDRAKFVNQFVEVMDLIAEICLEKLPETEFTRTPLFYSLFTALAYRMFGSNIEGLPTSPQAKLSSDEKNAVLSVVQDISSILLNAKEGNEVPQRYAAFVAASATQTDNIKPRFTRVETIYNLIFAS